jgi:DNA-binding Lrp family transcriptional regulator
MKQMGRGFVKVGAEKPDPEDVRMVEEAWAEAEKAIQSGEWDLVVLVKVPQYEDIAKIVTEEFPKVPGLQRTTTLTAFKAYSKADLEQAWDIGVE